MFYSWEIYFLFTWFLCFFGYIGWGFSLFFSLFSFLLLLPVFFSADEISCLFGEQLVFRFLFLFPFLL